MKVVTVVLTGGGGVSRSEDRAYGVLRGGGQGEWVWAVWRVVVAETV